MNPSAPGPYTLRNLAHEIRVRGPQLIGSLPQLQSGFLGPDRIDGKTRVLFFLRMARLMGCPVCLKLFPTIGAQAGLDTAAIRSAMDGRADGLSPDQFAVISWAADVMASKGEPPAAVSPEAMILTSVQRDHLVAGVRLELLIHATGLMFLPHRWIERAWQG
jgi:hypothetical protein